MALKFEFVQDDEFSDPRYRVRGNDNGMVGYLDYYYYANEWQYEPWEYYIDASTLHEIAAKLDELNESLKKQRILGVF